jgi:quercetin dioxygenase-like cupin family protein
MCDSSVQIATLSRMENEKMTGTLESHIKLASAFGISLPELYENVANKNAEAKEKAAREKVETFSHSSGAVSELLTTAILRKKMMPILLKLKPRGSTAAEEYPAGAERFIYVLKGSIELILDKQRNEVKQGGSFYFDGSKPHSIKNASKSEAWCISVLTPTVL